MEEPELLADDLGTWFRTFRDGPAKKPIQHALLLFNGNIYLVRKYFTPVVHPRRLCGSNVSRLLPEVFNIL
jgi:hypothetical protein